MYPKNNLSEINSIFKIVHRNLLIKNWSNLMNDAKEGMLNEIPQLLDDYYLDKFKKKDLLETLFALRPHVSDIHGAKIDNLIITNKK